MIRLNHQHFIMKQMGQAKGRSEFDKDELIELDMLLTPQQKREWFSPDSRQKRGAVRQGMWRHGVIPYSFLENTFNAKEKDIIYGAME